jgi:hypothetical protein
LDLVWNTPSESLWDLQLNTPAGDSRLEITRRHNTIVSSGDFTPIIMIDDQNKIIIEGHKTPILASELPCLLNGKWPMSWLKFLAPNSDRSGTSYMSFEGDENGRHLALYVDSNSNQKIQSCATMSWGGFWGLFKNSIKTCIVLSTGNYSVEITGIKNYSVKWWTDHESK